MTTITRDLLKPYLSSKRIQQICKTLAVNISNDYKTLVTAESPLLVVITLRGAMFFAADLLRHMSIPLCIDFVRLASYGAHTASTGTVRFLKDIETRPEQSHVLVLDEIVDSGRTLDFLIKRLKADEPRTLKVCTLLNKPSRREVQVKVDYVGLEVENKFLVGYGLDLNEHFRNLPDVYYLDERALK